MQHIPDLSMIDPYIFWEVNENSGPNLFLESYYQNISTQLYNSAFGSNELIGEYSVELIPRYSLKGLDPSLRTINDYLIAYEKYFAKESYNLTTQKIQEFQKELEKVFHNLDNLHIAFIRFQEKYPHLPQDQMADRGLKISSYMNRLCRLNWTANKIIKLLNLRYS